MGTRNEKLRNKFLESPTHAAMLRALFPEAVFIPKRHQVKAQVHLQSTHLHANIYALIDSGATDNFISPITVKHFNLPTYELPKAKIICNVNRTKNSIGPMTHATNLEVQYNNETVPLLFFVMNMGSDSMLLGMPFLAAYNPDIDWKAGIFHGDVTAFTKDTQEWTQENKEFIPELEEDDTEADEDYEFIPSN